MQKIIINIHSMGGGSIIIYIILLLISSVTSTIGSISGIGGGVILKPVMDAVTDMDADVISFLSGCAVLSMAVLSLFRSAKSTTAIDRTRGIPLAIGAALGGLAGKQLFSFLLQSVNNSEAMTSIQSLILCILTIGVMVYMKVKYRLRSPNIKNPLLCVLLGFGLGILSSFLGIGGGPINIAIISFFLAMDAKTTALHSILTIFISQIFSLSMTFLSDSVPAFNTFLLLPLIIGSLAGALLGSHISMKISNETLEKLFASVLILVFLVVSFNTVSGLLQIAKIY